MSIRTRRRWSHQSFALGRLGAIAIGVVALPLSEGRAAENTPSNPTPTVAVVMPKCGEEVFPMAAFLDSLRVELVATGMPCCTLVEASSPVDVGALQVHLESAEACGTEPERVRLNVRQPDRTLSLERGDVVREFVDAMRSSGMRIGFYLSPSDKHFPDSSPGYIEYFKGQLTELLTNYGPVHEIYMTGDRSLTALDWKSVAALSKRLQPNILVWMGPELATVGADLRYLGNQYAHSNRSTSSIADVPNGGPSHVWYPADAPFSDRGSSWFWHADGTVIPLDALKSAYFSSIGMNTSLIVNVPPSTTGQFDVADINLLQQFGAWYSALYGSNSLRNQTVVANSTFGAPGFDARKIVDDDVCTYWAAAEGTTTARLEVTPASPVTIQTLSIREPIELGERSTGYHVEFKQNGAWNASPTDTSGARIQGTVIGQRQLWQLSAVTVEALALVIDSAHGVPAIAEFAAY